MKTLLIVEDEKKIRQGIRSMALRSGVQIGRIVECMDGERALEIIKTESIDVMITDIRMPRMDGITLVKSMQSCRQPPLTIVLSGYDDFTYAVELMRCGIREYILKPVDREQLFAALRKMDAELLKRQAALEKTLKLNRQQLKYLMLNREITKEELDVITEQFTQSLFRHDYIVCCAALGFKDDHLPDGILSLGTVESMAVYLAESVWREYILEEGLCGPGTGISLPHRELGDVRAAFEEAAHARRTSFKKNLPSAVFDGKIILGAQLHEEEMERILHLLNTGRAEEAVKKMEQIALGVSSGVIDINDYACKAKALTEAVSLRLSHFAAASSIAWEPVRNVFFHPYIRDHLEAFKTCVSTLCGQIKNEEELSRTNEKIRLALTYMQENYHTGLNMATVSNHISMNYSQFSNAFKEYTGVNFVNYLQDLRMAKAKHLLRTTDMKVFEISWKVGYLNEKHFMKTFRAVCGISPTEYRREGFTAG